ncbi:DUF3040 domain-containing protein [Streptomyces sp. SHP 1-2]|uniref:DUF3040 domain-containing protein n=1 Tax=Streptomyces sp. SHP 1-2 TaxID=2769489 RepID=UPI002238609E|nr:DUF3040 domain-containing protein [Streptomyces sp. SHP 1-2]MCW5249851.1 DUF3040 domain-containing protein [Streptomyces sp. SHP 1-2]
MPRSPDDRLAEIEARLRREDPRLARTLARGLPRRSREGRRRWLRLLPAVALALLGLGIALPHGLLIATGLVLAGVAGELLAPGPDTPPGGTSRFPRR